VLVGTAHQVIGHHDVLYIGLHGSAGTGVAEIVGTEGGVATPVDHFFELVGGGTGVLFRQH